MDAATKVALTVFLATTAAFGGYQAYQSFTNQYYQTFNQREVHTGQFNKTKHNETEHKDNVDNANGGSVIKVTDHIYVAFEFAFANSIMVDAPDGLIIVDTTGAIETGRDVLREFRKISNKTIKAIIYTHQHPDHTWGAKAFIENPNDPPEIWAHHTTPEALNLFLTVGNEARERRSYRQFGGSLETSQETMGLLYPNKLLKDERLEIKLAGLDVILYHIPGETDDQIGLYIPRDKAFLSGDDFYQAFPNIYTIRGATARDAVDWYSSLDTIIDMEPEHLLPSHNRPISGKQDIRDVLIPYRDAIQYVHDQTVRLMNKGMTPDDIAHHIHLPEKLHLHPSLHEAYGTMFWSVKGIFDKYLGWFSGDPADLFPLPSQNKAAIMVKLVGGLDNLVAAAKKALNDTHFQWALELSSHALKVNNSCQQARNVKVEALKSLAALQKNMIARNYYLTCAKEESGIADSNPTFHARAHVIDFLPVEELFVTLRMKFQPEVCGERNTTAMFAFPDVNQTISIQLRNGVAVVKNKPLTNSDLKVTTTSSVWKQLLITHFKALVSVRDQIRIEGGIAHFMQFILCFQG